MLLRFIAASFFASEIFLGTAAHADMTVQRLPVDVAPPVLLLKGKFSPDDDPTLLAREVAASGAKLITFQSGGGSVTAAMAYGRMIRSLGLTTVQLRTSECASACTLAFVGGVIRQAEPGSIGVHQSSFAPDSNLDAHAAVTVVQSMTAEIMAYLIEMGVDPKLLQLSLSVPSDDMRYLTTSEMRAYRVIAGDVAELANGIETSRNQPAAVPNAEPSAFDEGRVPDPQPSNPTPEQKALAFLTDYHDAWSTANGTAMSFMDRAYGDVVNFYGKSIPKAAVLDEKRKFAARWPTRAYTLRPGSERVSCMGTCRVEGVVDWYAKRDVGDRVSSGSATFSLVWDPSDGKILSETSEVIDTDKNASAPVRLLSRWNDENLHCRGDSGDRPETIAACGRREAVEEKLKRVGWCYGREGEYGYQMQWYACDTPKNAGKGAVGSSANIARIQKPKFSDYPSRMRLKGTTVLPDFRKRDRDFNSFRTRIRDGMKLGPNFAGHFSVIQFGCGTGCSSVIVGDNQSGRPARFPRGGEDNMYLDLQFRLTSRLLAAQWLDSGTGRCVVEFFDYDQLRWDVVDKVDIGPTDTCYRSINENLQ